MRMNSETAGKKLNKEAPVHTGKAISRLAAVILLLCMAAYLGIAFYYMDGFSFGTWINGVYCTGKSVEEVNGELLARTEQPELQVAYPYSGGRKLPERERHESSFTIEKDVARQDYTKPLQVLLMQQRPLLWYRNLFMEKGGYEVLPTVSLLEEGKERFAQQFLADSEVQAERQREDVIALRPDAERGYVLYDGKANRLNTEMALQECLLAIEEGKERITLSENCYTSEAPTKTEKEQEALYGKLEDFLDFDIVYDMGTEQVKFDKKALVDMLALDEGRSLHFLTDEDGNFIWDEEKTEKAVDTLADAYDTYGKPRQFVTSGGNTVTLTKGTYGTKIDRQAEVEWLSAALSERRSQTHIPVYEREAWARGENDIGDTYIEINITQQKLWFYQNGELALETPVVTGNMLRHRDTPDGVYYIYLKQKNRTLRGPGYASHVNYWMPVKGGVGIHDALWRDEFGGDIYQSEGSHGCINIPLEAAEKLYELTEVGMPVILYYE